MTGWSSLSCSYTSTNVSRGSGLEKLADSKETKWRVTGDDWRRNEEYDAYLKVNEEMLAKTDTDFAPWTIVEATDKRYAAVKIYKTVIHALETAVKKTAGAG